LAAQAAEAAGKQGKFWEMAAVLFEKQSEWSESNQPLVLFNTYAKQIDVDSDKLVKEITNSDIRALVEADYLSGLVARINATPTFFVNGQKMNNLSGPDDLVARIELTLQEATASAKK
jgi:protein-disulfide isomerase